MSKRRWIACGRLVRISVLIDTDVIIWNLRGNEKAADLLDSLENFTVSSVTYMELVQGMRNKSELRALRAALKGWQVQIAHVTEGISARAAFLVEEFYLSNAIRVADALIAATALEYGAKLLTANDKHYRVIEQLEIEIFRP